MNGTVQYLLAVVLRAATTALPCDTTFADRHSKSSRDAAVDKDPG